MRHFTTSTRLTLLRSFQCLILFSVIQLISGCIGLPDVETSQELSDSQIMLLKPGRSIGQTIIPRRSNLEKIELWLSVPNTKEVFEGKITLAIYNNPGQTIPLRSVTVALAQIASGNLTTFEFTPLELYPDEPVYLELTTNEEGISVYGRNEDQYPYGSAYVDKISTGVDLAFRTGYSYTVNEFITDVHRWISNFWILFPIGIVLFLPGYLLIGKISTEVDPAGTLAEIIGLSLAVIPLVLFWTTTLGWHWNRTTALLLAGIMIAITIINKRHIGKINFTFVKTPHVLALFVLTIFTLITRLIMSRELILPAWVDSVHHAVITRLILDRGAVPASFAPLMNISAASYHSGYHTGLAFFTWLSGLRLEDAMLLYGQVLNALIVPAIYLLTIKLRASRWSAIFAGLLAGLFTPMPAYYTSWGRYTALAGLLILPAAFSMVIAATNRPSTRRILLASISCAGLFMVHYRLAAFMAILLAVKWVVGFGSSIIKIDNRKTYLYKSIQKCWRVVLSGGVGILLLGPWLPDIFRTLFIPKLAQWEGSSPILFEGFAWSFLTTAWGRPAIILAVFGLIMATIRSPRLAMTMVLWIICLFFLANVGPLNLPGSSFISNLSVTISLFIPTSILGGYFIGEAAHITLNRIPEKLKKPTRFAFIVATCIAAIFAARDLIPILRPITFLARKADIPAIQWIANHVPKEETVLINPTAWGYHLYQGADGGYWISPLSGLPTIPPPVLYGLENNMDRILETNTIIEKVLEASSDPVQLHTLLSEKGINYIYTGARGGVLSPRLLVESGLFTSLYQGNGTWVLHLVKDQY